MYKEFLGLEEPPFNLTPDPRFLYLSRHHREALASLIYGIKERKGFIALTGEIGSGKTTLCRAFLRELNPDAVNVALILNSFLDETELLRTVNDELAIPATGETRKELIDTLNQFLLDENAKGKTTVLIIDEAQNLTPAVLEQIRMLGNLETEANKLLQIVLIGQPQLADILALPELEQLAQRITVRFHIGPLKRDEIYHYIRHRLHVAGAKINISLTPAALNRIYHYSRGIPRRINLLCDRALLAAYVAGRFQIDAKMVATSEKEMKGRQGRPALASGLLLPRPGTLASLLFLAFATAAVLAGAFWAGVRLGKAPATPPALSVASRDSPADSPDSPGLALPSAKPESMALPASPTAAPTPLPTAAPLPAGTAQPREWHYDENDVARVSDPGFAYTASLLTVSNLWKHPVDLDIFRSYERETILGLNMPEILGKMIHLQSFETTAGLRRTIELDLPLVLEVEEPLEHLSRWVVLTRVQGEACSLADPSLGLVRRRLQEIETILVRTIVFYVDPDDFASLVSGEEREAVTQLRGFLSRQGVWQGEASPRFDENMTEAVKRFQQLCRQEPTGRIDGPTAARIAARRRSFRPHLFQGVAQPGSELRPAGRSSAR
ncbi:MAG TPA: AAA family ATPase [Sumerlaeia bacterium]|nr:AAA family ATPase [Sumerlaeia bacterium]